MMNGEPVDEVTPRVHSPHGGQHAFLSEQYVPDLRSRSVAIPHAESATTQSDSGAAAARQARAKKAAPTRDIRVEGEVGALRERAGSHTCKYTIITLIMTRHS